MIEHIVEKIIEYSITGFRILLLFVCGKILLTQFSETINSIGSDICVNNFALLCVYMVLCGGSFIEISKWLKDEIGL